MLHDGHRYHVARSELAVRVGVPDEAMAAVVDDVRALAAHGLGDEDALRAGEVERRRMELHELDVLHLRAGAVRRGDAVTRRAAHIAGLAKEPSRSPRRQHDGRREERVQPHRPRCGPAHRRSARLRSTGRRRTCARGSRWTRARRPPRATRAGSRRRFRRRDAGCGRAVWPPSCASEKPPLSRSKRAPCATSHSMASGAAPVTSRTSPSWHSPQTGAERVAGVLLRGIRRPDRRGDSPLRPRRVAHARVVLEEDRHPRAGLGRGQRCAQPGDTAADHENTRVVPRKRARVEVEEEAALRGNIDVQRCGFPSGCSRPSAAATGSSLRRTGVTRWTVSARTLPRRMRYTPNSASPR